MSTVALRTRKKCSHTVTNLVNKTCFREIMIFSLSKLKEDNLTFRPEVYSDPALRIIAAAFNIFIERYFFLDYLPSAQNCWVLLSAVKTKTRVFSYTFITFRLFLLLHARKIMSEELESRTPNLDISYNDFVHLHQLQLQNSCVPQIYWKTLFNKLKNEVWCCYDCVFVVGGSAGDGVMMIDWMID